MCFFNQVNRCIWSKETYHHLETPKLQEDFLSKTNSIITGNNVLYSSSSNTNSQFLRDTCVSSLLQNRPIWNKLNHSPP
jgi:hypothetical protein